MAIYLSGYAKRAGKMKYHKTPWVQALIKRIWAYNNRYSKCLGGE